MQQREVARASQQIIFLASKDTSEGGVGNDPLWKGNIEIPFLNRYPFPIDELTGLLQIYVF